MSLTMALPLIGRQFSMQTATILLSISNRMRLHGLLLTAILLHLIKCHLHLWDYHLLLCMIGELLPIALEARAIMLRHPSQPPLSLHAVMFMNPTIASTRPRPLL